MSDGLCTFSTPMHWTVMVAFSALAVAAMWFGYCVGHVCGHHDAEMKHTRRKSR